MRKSLHQQQQQQQRGLDGWQQSGVVKQMIQGNKDPATYTAVDSGTFGGLTIRLGRLTFWLVTFLF
jgi:hypothetical protein